MRFERFRVTEIRRYPLSDSGRSSIRRVVYAARRRVVLDRGQLAACALRGDRTRRALLSSTLRTFERREKLGAAGKQKPLCRAYKSRFGEQPFATFVRVHSYTRYVPRTRLLNDIIVRSANARTYFNRRGRRVFIAKPRFFVNFLTTHKHGKPRDDRL